MAMQNKKGSNSMTKLSKRTNISPTSKIPKANQSKSPKKKSTVSGYDQFGKKKGSPNKLLRTSKSYWMSDVTKQKRGKSAKSGYSKFSQS